MMSPANARTRIGERSELAVIVDPSCAATKKAQVGADGRVGGDRTVDDHLSETTHSLVLDADAVAKGKQKDLDDLGIAKNAREEKLRARKIEVTANEKSAEDERMAALYRQHVLKEQAPEPVIKIAGLGGKKKPAVQDVVHNKPE
jgi:hypothetical protein